MNSFFTAEGGAMAAPFILTALEPKQRNSGIP
jgi:hypothetical protein